MSNVIPEKGIHPDVPASIYHEWHAVSNSWLSRLAKSPAHLAAYLDEEQDETPAQRFGRAAHAAILEPDVFESAYCRLDVDRRTKAGKAEWDNAVAEHGADYILKPDDYDACLRMRDSVHSKRRASGMLAGDGEVELSCVWEDPDTGVLCKGRMDRYSADLPGGAVVDLKTTRSASRDSFERDIWNYGYYRQAAHYLAGADALGLPARHFVILAVEKSPPYECMVYRILEAVVERGREHLKPLMEQYAELTSTPMEDWPGYADEVIDIGLPDWAWRKEAV